VDGVWWLRPQISVTIMHGHCLRPGLSPVVQIGAMLWHRPHFWNHMMPAG
jgi:hypothetical protein